MPHQQCVDMHANAPNSTSSILSGLLSALSTLNMSKLGANTLSNMLVVALLPLNLLRYAWVAKCQPATAPPMSTPTTSITFQLVVLVVNAPMQINIFCSLLHVNACILVGDMWVVYKYIRKLCEPGETIDWSYLEAISILGIGLTHPKDSKEEAPIPRFGFDNHLYTLWPEAIPVEEVNAVEMFSVQCVELRKWHFYLAVLGATHGDVGHYGSPT